MTIATIVATFGQSEYRLASQYDSVFLKPPAFTSFLAADRAKKRIVEYDLATGQAIGDFGLPAIYQPCFARPAKRAPRFVNFPRGNATYFQVWDHSENRLLLEVPKSPSEGDFNGSLSDDGRRVARPLRDFTTEQFEADLDLEGHFSTGVRVFNVDAPTQQWEFATLQNYGLRATLSPNGRWLAVQGERVPKRGEPHRPDEKINRTVQVFDVEKHSESTRIEVPARIADPVIQFVGDADELLIASFASAGLVGFYSLLTGEKTRGLAVPKDEYRGLSQFEVSSNGRYAAAVGLVSGSLYRWDLKGKRIKLINSTPSPFGPACEFDDCRPRDLTVANDGRVTVLQVVGLAVCAWAVVGIDANNYA